MLKNRIIPCLDVKNGRVVKGMDIFFAVSLTIFSKIFLFSLDAVISKKQISSAPPSL